MDLAPDGSVLYVGTMSGDLYTVDPVQLVIIKRYPADGISPNGFIANAVYAMSNGKLLLMQYFLVPGYSFVDGNGPIALWNPADNSIVQFGSVNGLPGTPSGAPTCFDKLEFGMLTNNRTRFLMTPVLTGGGSSLLCSLDPNAGTFVYSPVLTSANYSSLSTLAVSPDGKMVAAFDGTTIYVLDAATLTLKSQFPVASSQTLFSYPSMVIGADNKTLYISGPQNNAFIYSYDLTTGKQTGWLPAIQLGGSLAASNVSDPYLQAISSNGLIAGVLDQGVGLLDTTALNPLPVGTPFGGVTASVAFGPAAGGTETSWWQSSIGVSPLTSLGSIYFGTNAATNISASTVGTETLFSTSPAGAPGPVDLVTVTPDGGEELIPDGFSYGPWVLEATTNYATAEGGGSATAYGYGFGPGTIPSSSTPATPPADLQVQVGGKSATVAGYDPDPYYNAGYVTKPLPVTGLTYTVPPGIAGTTADVTITDTAGTTTVKNALTYLPAVKTFSAAGSTLIDGVYDPKRDVYYFTDTTQVRVFSRTQGQWLAPIAIPKPAGAYAAQRLYGIALSPDDSKLAVADFGAVAVYVINPDNPSSIQSFPFGSPGNDASLEECPTGIAITNSGQVYLATSDEAGDGSPFLLQLDTTTGQVRPVYNYSPGGGFAGYPQTGSPFERNGRLPMSADGTRIYFNNAGQVGYVNTTNGILVYSSEIGQLDGAGYGSFEAVLAANQTRVFVNSYTTDSQLNLLGFTALNYRENADANYVYGAALSPDGNLIFQPGLTSIDLFDGRTGSFRGRVALPVTLSANYRALVSDGKDDVFVAITGSGDGIAVVDLGAVQEPAPVQFVDRTPAETATTQVQQGLSAAARISSTSLSPAASQAMTRLSARHSHLRRRLISRHAGERWSNND